MSGKSIVGQKIETLFRLIHEYRESLSGVIIAKRLYVSSSSIQATLVFRVHSTPSTTELILQPITIPNDGIWLP